MSKIKSNSINRPKMDWLFSQPIDTQLSVAQQHFEIVRIVLNSILVGSVCELAGEKYKRNGPNGERYQRWASTRGASGSVAKRSRWTCPVFLTSKKGSTSRWNPMKSSKSAG